MFYASARSVFVRRKDEVNVAPSVSGGNPLEHLISMKSRDRYRSREE